MKITKINNHNLQQTLNEIERLVNTYYKDVKILAGLNIYQVFDLISKNIKFEKDPKKTELILRPKYLLKKKSGDCDCKTVLFLSWLKLKKYPCGYSVVSDSFNKPFHHIFPFMYDKNNKKKIIDLDATYPWNKIGVSKFWKKRLNFYMR